jgi:starch synthase
VPPGDAASLAGALSRIARDPDLAARLGDAGYRRLHERFSWKAIVQRWLDVYASVTASAGATGPS